MGASVNDFRREWFPQAMSPYPGNPRPTVLDSAGAARPCAPRLCRSHPACWALGMQPSLKLPMMGLSWRTANVDLTRRRWCSPAWLTGSGCTAAGSPCSSALHADPAVATAVHCSPWGTTFPPVQVLQPFGSPCRVSLSSPWSPCSICSSHSEILS